MTKCDVINVCSFSAALDSLTRKQQADEEAVLAVLHQTGRFSCFEASENPTIAATMTRLCRKRLKTEDAGFPWTRVVAIDGVPLQRVAAAE